MYIDVMRDCLIRVVPTYLRSFCTLVSSIAARSYLRSFTRGRMVIPCMRFVIYYTVQSRIGASTAYLLQMRSGYCKLN